MKELGMYIWNMSGDAFGTSLVLWGMVGLIFYELLTEYRMWRIKRYTQPKRFHI